MIYRSAWFSIDHPVTLHFAAETQAVQSQSVQDLFGYIHPTDLPSFLSAPSTQTKKINAWRDLIGQSAYIIAPTSSLFASSRATSAVRVKFVEHAAQNPETVGLAFFAPNFALFEQNRHCNAVRQHVRDLFIRAKAGDKAMLVFFSPPLLGFSPIAISWFLLAPDRRPFPLFYPSIGAPIPCIGASYVARFIEHWFQGHLDMLPKRAVVYLAPHFTLSPEQETGKQEKHCVKAVPLWYFAVAGFLVKNAKWAYLYLRTMKLFLEHTDYPKVTLASDADLLCEVGLEQFPAYAFSPSGLPRPESREEVQQHIERLAARELNTKP